MASLLLLEAFLVLGFVMLMIPAGSMQGGDGMMVRAGRQLFLGMILALLATCCRADIPLEQIQHAKLATALVDVEEVDGIAEGSAFCIDASGLFVTNAHVVEGLKSGGKLTLVLYSGEKEQVKLAARVVMQEKEMDLAILQAVRPHNLTTMKLGSSDGLVETMPVAAFGYPFGSDLAVKDGDYPAITVSTGHITALRKVDGKLASIQLDASLNPGNSGGPIIDSKGDVIGIVMEGIPGSGINSAIPVVSLRTLLTRMNILFTPPVVQTGHLDAPHQFHIQLLAPPQNAEKVTVDLTLSVNGKEERTFHATTTDGRTFDVAAPLLPAQKGSLDLQLTMKGKNSSIIAYTPDKKIIVGTVEIALSQIRRIQLRPDSEVTLADNDIRIAAISRLPVVEAKIRGVNTAVNMADYDIIDIQRPSIEYHIRAAQGEKLIADLNGKIALSGTSGAPATADAVARTRKPALRAGSYELLVCGFYAQLIKRFDGVTGEYIDDFAVGNGLQGPHGIAIGPDNDLYVGDEFDRSVIHFDGVTGRFVSKPVPPRAGQPALDGVSGIAFGRDGNLYVGGMWTNDIKVFNPTTNRYLGNFVSGAGLNKPEGMVFGPDGNLYVSSTANSLIKCYDGRTGTFRSDFAGGNGMINPMALCFGPDGNLYVCSYGSHEVKRFNGQTGAFMGDFVPAGRSGLKDPTGLAFGPDNNLYVSDFGSGDILRFDGRTGAFIDTFASGHGLRGAKFILFRRKR
ncbi:MAG: putative lipoprotein [Chthonomonadaceae bacterium]|nr:putative lipoprotein [Chthonomonadaceae bacterium]